MRSSRNLCRQFPSNSHLEHSRITSLLGIHTTIPNIKREIEDLILFQPDSQQSPKTTRGVSGTYPASFFHAEKPLSQSPHFLCKGFDSPSSQLKGPGMARGNTKSFPLGGSLTQIEDHLLSRSAWKQLLYSSRAHSLLSISLWNITHPHPPSPPALGSAWNDKQNENRAREMTQLVKLLTCKHEDLNLAISSCIKKKWEQV